jgi:hypothetical protein
VLIDFAAPAVVERWAPIDDVVMGGVSRSRLERTPSGAAFTGVVSLDNGGGFASVRSRAERWPSAGAAALVLVARGDGKRYKLTARTDAGFDGVQYQCAFDAHVPAQPQEWPEFVLPVPAFVASVRGRRVPGAPPLDPAAIRQFGLMISEKQAGPFRLEVARLLAR